MKELLNMLNDDFTEFEKQEITRLLSKKLPSNDDLENIWYLMDEIWEEYGCDNKNFDWEKIGKFYSHPVWLLNGLFIENHKLSIQHRNSISNWIVQKDFKIVLDFGGGYGTLAKLIAEKDKSLQVDIFDPYPSEYVKKVISRYSNVCFVDDFSKQYDCVIAIDVFEHVSNPLKTFSEMIDNTRVGGYLLIANCFYPVIKCHLPQTFHLRYSFNLIASQLGLKKVGLLEGSHATIFEKIEDKKVNWFVINLLEKASKILFPFLKTLFPILRPMKNLILK